MKIKDLGVDYMIKIDAFSYRKLMYVTKKYNNEFTSLLHVEKKNNCYIMRDTFFPTQDNTKTTTRFESKDVMEIINEGFDISIGNGHYHSHVEMGTNPSEKDYQEIIDRATISGFNVAVIGNKKGSLYGHIADINNNIYLDGVPVSIIYPFSNSEFEHKKLSLLTRSKTLKEAEKAMKYSEYKLFEEMYPFSNSEKEELDQQINKKFYDRNFVIEHNYGYGFDNYNPQNTGNRNRTLDESWMYYD